MNILEHFKKGKGFIAALDQSGGSSRKTLINYGYTEDQILNDEIMFNYIHEMRTRIITNPTFTSKHVLGTIIFKNTMERNINGINTVKYLKDKEIPVFLKIDVGLDNMSDGVEMLKEIPDLNDILDNALEYGIIGTKMRSVIKEYNEYGIKKLVDQQFELAKKIINKGLIPIIEPEVDINSKNKKNIETYLKKELIKHIDKLNKDQYIILKLTIPDLDNFYDSLANYQNVLRIVALSGGYSKNHACELLTHNKKLIASFSRALLEGLSIKQDEETFTKSLQNNILEIYNASIKK